MPGVAHGLRDERVLILDLVALVQNQVTPVDGPAQRLAQVRAVHHVVRSHRHVKRARIGQHLHRFGGPSQVFIIFFSDYWRCEIISCVASLPEPAQQILSD